VLGVFKPGSGVEEEEVAVYNDQESECDNINRIEVSVLAPNTAFFFVEPRT